MIATTTILNIAILCDKVTTSRLALSAISPLFVDQFGRSLRFYHLDFDKEAISDGCWRENTQYRCFFGF